MVHFFCCLLVLQKLFAELNVHQGMSMLIKRFQSSSGGRGVHFLSSQNSRDRPYRAAFDAVRLSSLKVKILNFVRSKNHIWLDISQPLSRNEMFKIMISVTWTWSRVKYSFVGFPLALYNCNYWDLKRKQFNILTCTLVYRIDVHARLLILREKSPLHGLILVCTIIDFEIKVPPARLFHPARLMVLVCGYFGIL